MHFCRAEKTLGCTESNVIGGGGGGSHQDGSWLRHLYHPPRYPNHTPREACYGDMDGFPGVRNYGVVDPDDLYDVYCYAEELNGDWGWEVPRGRDPSPGLPLGPPGPLLDLTILCLSV